MMSSGVRAGKVVVHGLQGGGSRPALCSFWRCHNVAPRDCRERATSSALGRGPLPPLEKLRTSFVSNHGNNLDQH